MSTRVPSIGSSLSSASQDRLSKRKFEEGTDQRQAIAQKQKFELSDSQQNAINAILSGQNVYLTGSAGSGKSFLLQKTVEALYNKYSETRVAVTATTGVAATNIGGVTTHSWSGITNSQLSVSGLVVSIKLNKQKLAIWQKVRVLIIDEISMLDGIFLDKLNELAKRVRKSDAPFGGIQLVFCGDFFQLPPVAIGTKKRVFAFESDAWRECKLITKQLASSYRQKDDSMFQGILNEARIGELSDKSILALYNVQRKGTTAKSTIKPLQVFSKRARVDAANKRQLVNLNQTIHTFNAKDKIVKPGSVKNVKIALNSALTIPESVEIAKGAQVMLVKNLHTAKGLVNGAVGVVESVGIYRKDFDENRVEDDGWESKPSLTSQSNRKVLYKEVKSAEEKGKVGVMVNFDNGAKGLITPIRTEMEDDVGDTIATRFQIPLTLAWATTIHKSQGKTLPKISIHFDDIFEHGMGYVALSRVRCLEDLYIKGFEKSRIIVDKKVKKFETVSTS